jgi:hypothetical protein
VKLAGKRFWTWISVAVLSVFVKSGGDAFAQEQTTTNDQSSTSQLKHNVPPGPHAKTRSKVVDKIGTLSAYKLNSSGGTGSGLKTTGAGLFKHDATSKDAAKMSLKTNLKTASAIGEKRDVELQSGLKTTSRRSGGDDTPTESATKSKHHGLKKSK